MNLENMGQLDIFNQTEQAKKIEEKDSKGRTRADIKKESKSLSERVLGSITYQDGQYYIEGIPADEWIARDDELNKKDNNYYKKGQW